MKVSILEEGEAFEGALAFIACQNAIQRVVDKYNDAVFSSCDVTRKVYEGGGFCYRWKVWMVILDG